MQTTILINNIWNFPFITSATTCDYFYCTWHWEYPHELPNNLKLRILGNYEISRKLQIFLQLYLSAQSFPKNENFVNASKKLQRNRNLTFPILCFFTLKLEFVSNVLFMIISGNSFLLTYPRSFQSWFGNDKTLARVLNTILTWPENN